MAFCLGLQGVLDEPGWVAWARSRSGRLWDTPTPGRGERFLRPLVPLSNKGMHQTRSALPTTVAALAGDPWCSADSEELDLRAA
jgi:hypothetical protein